uniref:Uncharacterized protein n=1 Tax=Anguilla anguilla TaxID=7936 RepID=A0A0E9UW09_ANGAN
MGRTNIIIMSVLLKFLYLLKKLITAPI